MSASRAERSRKLERPRAIIFLALGLVISVIGRSAHAAPFGYVVNHGDGTVSVIDTTTNVVVATVGVGAEPLGAAVNTAGTRAYVTNQVAPVGTVSVIDTALNGVVATVTVGRRPSGVAVKLPGDRVYVTNRDDKNVSVIDTATNTVIATVTVGNNPLGIAIDPAGNPAYVANKGTNDVSVIDTETNAVIATIPVGNDPSQLAVSPNGRRLYVSNNSNSNVSVIDTGLNSVITSVSVGSNPEGVAVDVTGARLYVANSGPDSVSVVDTATNAVVKTIDVGMTPFGLALQPGGAHLFVANRQSGDVSVIDTATNTVSATIDVGFSPAGMGQFIVPELRNPVFSKVALKCQIALTRQGIKLAKLHHGLEAACRLGVIKAEAAGKGTVKAEAACLKALDPGNPASRLSRARTKLRRSVAKSCGNVLPRDLNAPCARGADGFNATADCLIAQHGTYVEAMATNEFSVTRPIPLVGSAAVCQKAIAKQGRRFADRLHKDLGACLEKLLTATATGKNEPKAIAGCFAKLDLGNPIAKAAIARTAALVAMAQQCAGVTPAALGSPCDAVAADLPAVASCVLREHVNEVGKLIAAEFNDVCVVFTRIGLADEYLAVCSGKL